jgi:hypothetical protein
VASGNRLVQLFEATSNKVFATLHVPLNRIEVHGISATRDRLVLPTDQRTSLVIDFPGGLPAGTIDLGPLLTAEALPSTR